jgi:hypothetical protein
VLSDLAETARQLVSSYGQTNPMEKERVMKHLLAAVSLAVFAMPAAAGAAGLPYEQLVIDRTLPNIAVRASDATKPTAFGAPYEQYWVDRALPNIEPRSTGQSATAGETRSVQSGPAAGNVALPWANDYNFIAPAL